MYTLLFIFISDVDECSSVPCQHGGTCTDYVNKYTCTCPVGYAGTVCQTGKKSKCCIPFFPRNNLYTCNCASEYIILRKSTLQCVPLCLEMAYAESS